MADQARVERALRSAIDAGDMASARSIAQGWRDQQAGTESASQTGFDWPRAVGEAVGGTVGGVAGFATGGPVLSVLGGGAGATAGGELVDQARRFPELPPEIAAVPSPGLHMAHRIRQAIGGELAGDRSLGEAASDARDAFRQGAAGSVLGFLARGPLQLGENVLRSFGRGLRTRPGAQIAMQQHRAAQQAAGVVDDAGPAKTFFSEMAKLAGLGSGAEILSGGLTSGGAAIATTVLRLPEATKAVLTSSPGFARWALATAPSMVTSATGELAGQSAAQAGEGLGFTAAQLDDLIETMAAEGPEVAGAIRDFIRGYAEQEQGL